jgi:hypothetical protein
MEQERVDFAMALPARPSAVHVRIRQQRCLRFGVAQRMLDLQLRACAASVIEPEMRRSDLERRPSIVARHNTSAYQAAD